ncbi:MAG: hypothetical protein DMF59_00560 [Acidobacteria bacterium]|nr:MAG: hypothetical protein DMF59_00560 [Acidobacteriota bacterium]
MLRCAQHDDVAPTLARDKLTTMSDELSIQGTLAETTVPDLFRSLIRSSETAIVSLEGLGRTDVIYVNEGKITYASSTDPDMALGEVLLRSGDLNLQQYNQAMEHLVTPRRFGGLLCELGYLKPDDLSRAVERQASAIVLNAMRYRAGNYTIEFTSTFPDEIVTLPLSTERLILDGIARIDFWSLITRGLGRLERLLAQAPGSDARGYALELNEEENHIFSLLSEPATVQDVVSRSYLSNFVSAKTLWGLLTVNLLQDAEGAEVVQTRAAEETEYEMAAMVERYNTAFQKIFALVFQKIGDHIYDFVDRVVLHLSPETLPYLSGMNMVNEGRVDFDQLLNNIISSGSENQGLVVHSVLHELLYGWILEVKSEFGGTSLEKDIIALVNKVRK